MQVLVGRIGRPHGVRGEVTVEVRTDDPDARFAAGSVLATDPASAGPLTVERARRSGAITVLAFAGVTSREAAEALRGTLLTIDTEDLAPPDDPDEFYDHQLIGLRARHIDGTDLGEVTDVLHLPAAPALQVRTAAGDVLVPFVSAIVPTVDAPAGFLTIDPPDGMFDADAGAGANSAAAGSAAADADADAGHQG